MVGAVATLDNWTKEAGLLIYQLSVHRWLRALSRAITNIKTLSLTHTQVYTSVAYTVLRGLLWSYIKALWQRILSAWRKKLCHAVGYVEGM